MNARVRGFFYIIGLLFLTFGISLIILANTGAAPWDALAVGESKMFGISIGTCIFINGCILIFVNAYLLRARIEYLAAISIFIIGMMVDFWIRIGLDHFFPESDVQRYLYLLIGIGILGTGISIYLQSNLPCSPMDTFMIAIHKRFGLSIRSARLINEVVAVTLAIVFQGAIGIGTIIVALSIGLVIHYIYPIMERLFLLWSSD